MQQAMPDLGVLAAGDENGQLGIAIRRRLGRELESGARHAAVGALDDVEGEPRQTEVSPRFDQLTRSPRVEIEMHSAQVVRMQVAWYGMARAVAESMAPHTTEWVAGGSAVRARV